MNEPWVVAEMTYGQALENLVKQCDAYDGGWIGSRIDYAEHPLHLAVRQVEAFQEPDDRLGKKMRFHLPSDAWQIWGRILTISREHFKKDECGRRVVDGEGRLVPSVYSKRQRVGTKAAAKKLKAWANREIRRLKKEKNLG